MAHNLMIENGQAAFMFTGEPAWHGLGTKLESPATAAEAIKAAKLNWHVKKIPLFAIAESNVMPVNNKFAIVRADKWGKDKCPVFGIVSDGYTPLQNIEAFSFFDPIVKEKNAAIYHTAGALGDGERIWILAKLPGEIRVIGDDITNKYLLLSNSHDGLSSVQIKFTPIRVVCQNTLTMALNEGGPTLRIPHFRDLHERLKKAEEMLGIINNRYEKIEQTFQAMAEVQMNSERWKEYVESVFPNPTDIDNEKRWRITNRKRQIAQEMFEFGRGNQTLFVAGTLWAAYNGITEMIDYRSPFGVPIVDEMSEKQLNSIWFGEGYLTKARAYKVAKEKLKDWKN